MNEDHCMISVWDGELKPFFTLKSLECLMFENKKKAFAWNIAPNKDIKGLQNTCLYVSIFIVLKSVSTWYN